MKVKTYRKLYTIIVILIPVIAQYNILGGLLDFDVIAMLMIFVIGILRKERAKTRYNGDLFILFFYIITVTVINILVGRQYSDSLMIVLRAGRFLLYMYITMVMNIDLFDYSLAMSIYKKVAYLAFFYIIIQSIFYYGAGIVLPNRIGAATSSAAEISKTGEEIGRLRAFYSEPAAMAYAMVPFVVCSLFGEQYQVKDRRLLDGVMISISIILTTSGQGIVCVSVIWAAWMINQVIQGKMRVSRIIEISVLIVGILIISRTSLVEFTFGRILDTSSTGAVSARASGYKTLSLLNTVQLIFGTGYGNYVTKNIYGLDVPYEYVNYSSLSEHLFTTGIIGTLILVNMFRKRFTCGNLYVKMIFVVIAILSLSGSPLTGSFLPLFLSFAFCNINESNIALSEKQ